MNAQTKGAPVYEMSKGEQSRLIYDTESTSSASLLIRQEAPQVLATQDKIDLLKDTVARDQNLSDSEFELFVYICQHRGLDPFANQIYAIKRGGKVTFQTSIDGFRVIADRTGRYAPGRQTEFDWKEGKKYPDSATAYVKKYVAGEWHEVAETAYWSEYASGNLWNKMPSVMLAKVAEARALRRAFPQDLSGLYTDDEMMQAEASLARPPDWRNASPAKPQKPAQSARKLKPADTVSDASYMDGHPFSEAGEVEPERDAEREVCPLRNLQAFFSDQGFTKDDRDLRLRLASALAGKTIISFSDLSDAQREAIMRRAKRAASHAADRSEATGGSLYHFAEFVRDLDIKANTPDLYKQAMQDYWEMLKTVGGEVNA